MRKTEAKKGFNFFNFALLPLLSVYNVDTDQKLPGFNLLEYLLYIAVSMCMVVLVLSSCWEPRSNEGWNWCFQVHLRLQHTFSYTLNDAANLVSVCFGMLYAVGKAATNFMMHSKLFLFSARICTVYLLTSYTYRACVCSSAFRRVLKQRKLFRFYIIRLNGPSHCFVTLQYWILFPSSTKERGGGQVRKGLETPKETGRFLLSLALSILQQL